MKCEICNKEVKTVNTMNSWVEIDMKEGNLLTSEYDPILDFLEDTENTNTVCCKDCFEKMKNDNKNVIDIFK